MDDVFQTIRELLEAVQLLPPSYAQYQPLLVDALVYFFQRLSQTHLDEVVAGQLNLEPDADTDARLVALLQTCPTLHKLGQVVGHERGLAPALRARLQGLESLPPSTPIETLAAFIHAEVGAVAGLELASSALAEGSVAVVVPFTWTEEGATKRGVFKVLKPNAEERMREELDIWPELSGFLEERTRAYGLPMLDYKSMLDGVARLLRNEIDLRQEQDNLRWAGAFYATVPNVVIPRALPFSTPHVTAMDFSDGKKVTDPGVPVALRRRVAKTLVSALIARPFWKPSKRSVRFHADPHAGNLFVTADGQLAILDWALTTELSDAQMSSVVRSLMTAMTLDESGTVAAVSSLGRVSDPAFVQRAVAEAIAGVRRGTFPGFVWLMALLDRLGRAGAITFPEETALFRKSLLTLTGVVEDVSDGVGVDDVLVPSGALQFVRELRGRVLAPLDSLAFGTHVSNADLIGFWMSLPWAPTRFWLESLRDVLATREAAAGRAQPALPATG